ncbi:hypothetical protein HPB50_009187 [Hyalomma asiaticum]|uniref:Uncharacterized protein n=1 Tax=Hyalomma asiaticum TaxID=266040 RepID=A0ACB7SG47_HYAAI|nr:hypothetical protein HPB50_009187 [Hyalomma asiaticum]
MAPAELASGLSSVDDVVREEVSQAFSSPEGGNVPWRLTQADAVFRSITATSAVHPQCTADSVHRQLGCRLR